MGFTKGTMTFTRYRIEGVKPEGLSRLIDEGLRTHAFRDVRAGSEKSMGWTGFEDALDTNFARAGYSLGRFVVFSLRIDRKTVAPALLNIKALAEERKIASERNGARLKAEERKNIKEGVRMELLKTTHPVPAIHEVCWCPQEEWLLFGSASPAVRDDFEDRFKSSFDITPAPYLPWDPHYLPPSLAKKFSSLPSGPQNKGISFIGRDFLTWLWFKSEERGGSIMLPGTGDIELVFLARLVLESGEGEYAESVVCRGLHADLGEGKAALLREKKITEARLRMQVGNDRFEFTFKADRFLFQSLKIAAAVQEQSREDDREGALLERLHIAETSCTVMDRLFGHFLERRLSAGWDKEEVPRLKKWMGR